MTTRTDLERVLDLWLDEGPTSVPDHVFDATVAAVLRAPQQPSWRLRWRSLAMNRTTRLVIVGVAILAIAGLGFAMVASQTAPPTASPAPSTVASTSPSASTPTPLPVSCLVDGTPREPCKGPLVAGTYTFASPLVPFSAAVPDGWVNRMNILGGVMLEPQSSTDGVVYVWPDPVVTTQGSCEQVADFAGSRRVVDIVSFLTAHPGLIVADRQDVVVGGLHGQSMRISVNGSPGPCPGRAFLFVHGKPISDGYSWDIGGGDVMQVWLLEAGDGHTVLVNAQATSDKIDAFVAAATPIVYSMTFTRQTTCVDNSRCLGQLTPGTYSTFEFEVPLTYAVPEGWTNDFEVPLGYTLAPTGLQPEKAGIFVFLDVYASRQATCTRAQEPGVGRTAADLVAWLGTLPDLSTTTPVAVTVGGLSGYMTDVNVTSSGPACAGDYQLWISDYGPLFWGVTPGVPHRMYLLDVPGGRNMLIIVAAPGPTTGAFEDVVAPAEAIVETFEFAS